MRKDLEIHINTGDITLTPSGKIKLNPFSWVNNKKGLARYMYGEISIPSNMSDDEIYSVGINTMIPYTPVYKEFYVRIRKMYSTEDFIYLNNPVDGSEWFLVKTGMYGAELENTYASELVKISQNKYNIRIDKDTAVIYSAENLDMSIIPANQQNKNLLLSCVPTNNYRYPISGVGLIRWIKSNLETSNFSEVLEREFALDGTPVISADFNYTTNMLELRLDTSNVDKDGTI